MLEQHLKELLEAPIGERGERADLQKDAAARASKIWLPEGKRHWSQDPGRNRNEGKQIDIEEAIEAAGGHRGSYDH